MKRRDTKDALTVNGFYVSEVRKGFMGEKNEGARLLGYMGLSGGRLPFSAAMFLQNRMAFWKDRCGNPVLIWFRVRPDQIECFGSYMSRRKSYRVFREWSEDDSPEKIARLESEAIGDLSMRCIYDNVDLVS